MTYEAFWQPLTAIYETSEAKAVTRLVAEVRCGLTLADLMMGKEMTNVEDVLQRLLTGEPVQYVLGQAEFCGRKFHVAPGVLIPRPETEELCRWVMGERLRVGELCSGIRWKVMGDGCRILDIGTGSGCIAITLAAEMPEAEVEAWDISDNALRIARHNAEHLGVHVDFKQVDVLSPITYHPSPITHHPSPSTHHPSPITHHPSPITYHLIISNPPYVCESEASTMESWVLNHEPKEALFVPNSDPLLFYRHIAHFALTALEDDGRLYFEINPHYCDELRQLLTGMGFKDIQVRNDQFNKQRMICACKRKR